MICRPAARFAIGPFPPGRFEDRRFAAAILVPLVRFAMAFQGPIRLLLTGLNPD
jgi:hypothetical protein